MLPTAGHGVYPADERPTLAAAGDERELRDASYIELAQEPDAVLDALVAGDMRATETTRRRARAELGIRRGEVLL